MVNISFEPPLKADTRVRPAIQGDSTILLSFLATLRRSEWVRLQQQGSVVELWSNIPSSSSAGEKYGEWKGTPFREDENPRAALEKDHVQLRATLVTPTTRGDEAWTRYSYTYRIKRSFGDMHWLGSHSSNGYITVDSVAFWNPRGGSSPSTLVGALHESGKWLAWAISKEHTPAKLSLADKNATDVSADTLVLLPSGTQYEPCQAPPLLIHSKSGELRLVSREVHLDEENAEGAVIVETLDDPNSIATAMRQLGFEIIPTSSKDCFLLTAQPRIPSQTNTRLNAIFFTSQPPSTVEVDASSLTTVSPHRGSTMLYPPRTAAAHPPVLLGHGEAPIEIPFGSSDKHSINLVHLYSIPDAVDQKFGIATPARPVGPSSDPSSTRTAVDAPETLISGTGSSKKVATLTVSKASKVVFARTVPVPQTVTVQAQKLLDYRMLFTLYRVSLYIISFLIPFMGINLSLRISPGTRDRLAAAEEESKSRRNQSDEWETKKPRETSEVEGSFEYDVEPVDGEVHVTFQGDGADELTFALNGKAVDPWSVVQTWHGDDLHQFILRLDEPARLGISLTPSIE